MNAGKVVSSVFFNYLGVVVGSVTGFVATPVILHHLGKASFGQWMLIASIVAYSSLLDLGVGLTVMRLVAERAHLADRTELDRIASTALTLYVGVGLVLAAVGVAVSPFIGEAFHLSGSALHTFAIAFAVMAATVGITFPSGLYTGLNQGFGRYRQQNTILIAQVVLGSTLQIITVLLGGGLIPLVAIGFVGAAGAFVAKMIYAARSYGLTPSVGRFDRRTARSVIGVSSWMFLINVANKIIWDTDNVVIGRVLNTVAVSHYAVALGPATAVRRITDQFSSVSLTAASSLKARKELDGLRRLLGEGTRVVTVVIGPFAVLFALWGHDFLRLWVGPSLMSSASTLVVLIFGMLASSVQSTSTMVLLALERQRTLAVTCLIEALCNVALSVVLAMRLGILGVALGTTIPTSITAFGIYMPYAARQLGVPLARLFGRLTVPVVVCGAVYLGIRFLVPPLRFDSLAVFCLFAAVFVGMLGAVTLLLDREERKTYVGLAQTWGRRVLRTES